MFDLTQEKLDKLSYAQICTIVLKQQELLKQCNDVLGQAITTLESVKELAK